MKKILFALSVLCQISVWADMLPSPEAVKEMKNAKVYKTLRCKDPKNLVICHFSVASPDIDECHIYAEKPKEYKKIGHVGGASFGEEKYCALKGKDKN